MLAFVGFIGITIFIYLQFSGNIPNFLVEVKKENSRSEAYQISEILLNNPGEPINWDKVPLDRVKRLGLSDEVQNRQNLLSGSKIFAFNNTCNTNYLLTQKLIGLNTSFYVYFYRIKDSGERELLINCRPPLALIKETEINTTISRISGVVNTDGTKFIGELMVAV